MIVTKERNMKVIVNGSKGKMGSEVVRLVQEGYCGAALAAAADVNNGPFAKHPIIEHLSDYDGPADVIVDFSHHSAAKSLTEYALMRRIPVVVATTGQTEEELSYLRSAADSIPIFLSANMSVGVALLANLVQTVVKTYPDADIEIIETHHNQKLDAPSGTALFLAEEIKKVRPDVQNNCGRNGRQKRTPNEIGIHAVRIGSVVGEHEILISTGTETITLAHKAHSRALFAEGALVAAKFLIHQKSGLYHMQDMIRSQK